MSGLQNIGGTVPTPLDPFDPAWDRRNDRWLTPLALVRDLGEFDLDPCGAPGHPTAREVWTPEEHGDGLSMPWHGRVWLNPPYGRGVGAWIERLAHHDRGGIALLYARTDTAVFQELVFPFSVALYFIARRVQFQLPSGRTAGNRMQGPAPSVLIAFGDEPRNVFDHLETEGTAIVR